MDRIILGVDPGSFVTGYGLISCSKNSYRYIDSGCIKTNRSDQFEIRLSQIVLGMLEVLDKYCPNECAIEDVFVSKNIASALKLGQVRGAIIGAIQSRQYENKEDCLNIVSYSPRVVKKALSGLGGASKDHVGFMVSTLLNQSKDSFELDESDALALAITHANTSRLIA